jgi:hypothetical protein
VKYWIVVGIMLAMTEPARAQSDVHETTPTSPVEEEAPPFMELGLDAPGDFKLKVVKLKRVCQNDDDVECMNTLRVLFNPLDSAFGTTAATAHLQLVYADSRRPVKMLPQDKEKYRWKAALYKKTRDYNIDWDVAHPALKEVTAYVFIIVAEGSDEMSTPRFKFILP